ncbi:MAG: cytochrome c [Pseudomonadota bacterium]|nr:cytochrome c [Pseudomonadota bacterium]
MKHMIRAAMLAAAVAAVAVPAAAQQFAKTEDAIKYRQSAFSVLGTHFSRLGAMANGRAPFDAATAAADGEVIAAVAKLPAAGFVAGSDKGLNTKAKPSIWQEQDKFKDLNEKMLAEVAKLSAAAKTGNLDQLKAAFGPAAQSCKACHDAYRNR